MVQKQKENQTITVKIISTDNKGLIVRPEGCEMDFPIKISNAINSADASCQDLLEEKELIFNSRT